jgi:PAS domain S-box-containing protein
MKIMTPQSRTKQALLMENAELRARMEEADETLRAIHDGEVDAIIVGEHVYMLERAGTSSNLFRGEVLAQINDAVIAVDNHMRVTYLNSAAERLYGVTATKALGCRVNDLFECSWLRPEDEATAIAAIEATGIWRGENIHVTHYGQELHVELVVNRLIDVSGIPIGFLVVIRDISERKRAEAERAQLITIVESSADAIYSYDLDRRILNWNKSAEKLYGWKAEEIIGQHISLLIPHERQEEEIEILERLRRDERVDHYETVRLKKDGTTVDVSISVSPIKDGSGRIIGACKIARDITERKQAEVVQAYHSAIVESSDDAIVGKTLQGIITSWNKGAEKLFGYKASEILGQPITTLIPPDRHEEEVEILSRLRRGERVDHFETVRLRMDGRALDLSITISPIKDKSGRIIGASKVARDISERKRFEESLRTSERRFRELLEKLPAAAYTCDAEGLITYYNQRAVEMWGREPKLNDSEDRFCGSFKLFSIDGIPLTHDQCWMALTLKEDKEYNGYEIVVERPDGSRHPGLAHVTPIHDESGKLLGAVNVVVDISDRKRAEIEKEELLLKEKAARAEAQAANRSKDEFISLVSHELRSPLSSILGYNRILRSNLHNAKQITEACDVIQRNVRKQIQLIEDLLDISRIASGKLRLDLQPTDIVAVLDEALAMVRPEAEVREIKVYALYNPNPEMIIGDTIRLQQVIGNLLSNAIKFTPDGGRIELKLERRNNDLTIVVSDTGKGIKPEFLPHVFDRFRQADSSSSRRHGGLGLGLALVKHLVELHGGTVEAASDGIDLGSTFTIKLPPLVNNRFLEREPPALQMDDTKPLPDNVTIEGVRVLAVDDQQDAREALTHCLSSYGAVVTAVSSGIEAMAILADPQDEKRPEVFICDIAMPEEDGYAVIKRVRALEEERRVKISQRIPAIALSALAGRENWLRALGSGFNTHIAKPAEPEELVEMIYRFTIERRDDSTFK